MNEVTIPNTPPEASGLLEALEQIATIAGKRSQGTNFRMSMPKIEALARDAVAAAKSQPQSAPTDMRARLSALEDAIAAGEHSAASVLTCVHSWFDLSKPQSAQVAVPDGWQLVPKEPAREQIQAINLTFWEIEERRKIANANAFDDPYATALYRAGLAASPQPREVSVDGEWTDSQWCADQIAMALENVGAPAKAIEWLKSHCPPGIEYVLTDATTSQLREVGPHEFDPIEILQGATDTCARCGRGSDAPIHRSMAQPREVAAVEPTLGAQYSETVRRQKDVQAALIELTESEKTESPARQGEEAVAWLCSIERREWDKDGMKLTGRTYIQTKVESSAQEVRALREANSAWRVQPLYTHAEAPSLPLNVVADAIRRTRAQWEGWQAMTVLDELTERLLDHCPNDQRHLLLGGKL